ncbi:MAG: hypothetical protein HYV32_04265 [Candidatus Kerfeldbacteria bacterium]|nr:hypothetical protein [Candidatus Kerfeldbacteria bacterium]
MNNTSDRPRTIQVSIPFFVFLLLFILHTPPAHAFTFTKNLLITDKEAADDQYLSTDGIQAFLEEKGSILASYVTQDSDGAVKTAAEIISTVTQKYSLNPLLFLVMGNKESSAITSHTMTSAIENYWLGFGRCDSCSESVAEPYKGFTKQIYAAAERIRNGYLQDIVTRGYTISGWGPGISKITIDGVEVTPVNDITAALYTYNPCVGPYGGAGGYTQFGCNSLFQKLWQEWYTSKYTYRYPSGSLLQIGEVVYLIQGGKKHPFTSKGALLTNYRLDEIIAVPAVVGEQYELSTPIQFSEYSLLQDPAGTIYMYVDGKKRGFTSRQALLTNGFYPEEAVAVTWKDIHAIPDGEPITTYTAHPLGMVVQNATTGAVSYIDSKNHIHPIWSKEILQNRFPGQTIVQQTPEDLAQYEAGAPVQLKDGTLVRSVSGNAVYVISNHHRRPFASREVFDSYGYEWHRVIQVPQNVLQLHAKGKYIKLETVKPKKKKHSSSKK